MKQTDCRYYRNGCRLGYYGGHPQMKECQLCMTEKNNTLQAAKTFFELMEKAHPSGKPRVSGCCDSAENPPQANLSNLSIDPNEENKAPHPEDQDAIIPCLNCGRK
jgi:hypothetical protein